MKIDRNRAILPVIIIAIISNLIVVFNIKFLYLPIAFNLIYLMFAPGWLLYLTLKLKPHDFWEQMLYIVGLSIFFLIFTGLGVNTILSLFKISQPLAYLPLTISIHILMLAVGVNAYLRNKYMHPVISFPRFNPTNLVFSIIPVLFPILAAMGATSINNNGSNIFTMIMFGAIATYVAFIFFFRKKLDPNVYPISLFFIALSILLMTSLRGWYTTGHDNQQEYYVYLLTQNALKWDMNVFRDTYNACLSLNIFPTILNSFLKIDSLYIFKFVFQVYFAFIPIAVYLLLKKYTTKLIAFFSAFFFIAFPTFGNDMPMLNRQEIALFFFALSLLVLFNKEMEKKKKNLMFIILTFGMIVSHYSTSYIATALIIAVYILSYITRYLSEKKKINIVKSNKYYITFVMVITTLAFTFLWNFSITKTTSGFADVATRTIQNIGSSFNSDLKSSDTKYSLFSWKKTDKEELLKEYVQLESDWVEKSDWRDVYPTKEEYQKYPILLADSETIPLTKLGQTLKNIKLDPFTLHNLFKQGSAKLIQLFVVIGLVIMLFRKSRNYKALDIEYVLLSVVSIVLLGAFILLPVLSNSYGTLRFFQQTLITLSLPMIVGAYSMIRLIFKKNTFLLTYSFILVFFLSLYGFLPELTGGFYPTLNMRNMGDYYNIFYTHESEVKSVEWLKENNNQSHIQSNYYLNYKMLIYLQLGSLRNIFPAEIEKDSYVFLDYYNTVNKKNQASFKSTAVIYYYPLDFLNKNKNTLYNNGESIIYK